VKRAAFFALAVTAALFWVTSPASAKVHLKKVGRFSSPTYVTSAPGTPGIFVVEQGGRVVSVDGSKRHVFLNITGLVKSGGEQGLLSIAFPGNYISSGLFYVYYTGGGGDINIAEYHRASRFKADPNSRRTVLVIPHPNFENHNGGQLQFGPDGFLYIGTGDGGGAGDTDNSAQQTNNLLGKILRIDPTQQGSAPYTSPASNALGAGAGRDEIFAMGLRNPYRFSFDRGRILIGDVGQDKFEEVDYEDLAAANGANFGWNDFEGFSPFAGAIPPAPTRNDKPIYAYSHDSGGCSVIGGYVVRTKPKALKGRYVFGDFCTGKLQSFLPTLDGARKVRTLKVKVPMLSSFGRGANGGVYATSLDGPVYRLK
jgi:glucose/arabinose dehydrogenase